MLFVITYVQSGKRLAISFAVGMSRGKMADSEIVKELKKEQKKLENLLVQVLKSGSDDIKSSDLI